MGRVFLRWVDAETVHCCAACRAHLAAHESIISKAFQGRHGRAYLFGDVLNVNSGPTENRLLLTGLHVVADIYCNSCDTRLGWKYVEAFEESQKYKEGKFILEKAMILKEEEIRQRRAEQLERMEAARQRAAQGLAAAPDADGDGDDGGEDGEGEEEEDDDDDEEEEEEVDDDEEEEEEVDDDEEGGGGGPRSGAVAAFLQLASTEASGTAPMTLADDDDDVTPRTDPAADGADMLGRG